MEPLFLILVLLIGAISWSIYYKYSEENIRRLMDIEKNSIDEFINKAHNEKFKYDLSNPTHEDIDSIPIEKRFYGHIPIRDCDRDAFISDSDELNNKVCVIELDIKPDLPPEEVGVLLPVIRHVLNREYYEEKRNDGQRWRISKDWIATRKKLLKDALKNER